MFRFCRAWRLAYAQDFLQVLTLSNSVSSNAESSGPHFFSHLLLPTQAPGHADHKFAGAGPWKAAYSQRYAQGWTGCSYRLSEVSGTRGILSLTLEPEVSLSAQNSSLLRVSSVLCAATMLCRKESVS